MVAHPTFGGYLQPPTVPPDPTSEDWRGPQGLPGPPGPMGTTSGTILPTTPGPPGSGQFWSNGGFVMTS